jgi:Uma2 family endonuclease
MTAQELLDLPGKYRLRVADYRLLDDAGVFRDFAKTELIEGEIVAVNAQYLAHSRAQRHFLRALDDACRALGGGIEAVPETAIDFGDETMPQPDIVVARDAPETGALPRANVALIVEIADTTARFDLGGRVRLYAGGEIPEYWVADLNTRTVHQMWRPEGESYAELRQVRFGARLVAATIEGLAVEAADF